MAAATNYAEEKILKHFLGITSFTMPGTIKVHLHTADPTEVVSSATEVSGGSYAAVTAAFTWDGTNLNAENSAAIEFVNMPATTVSHWSISDNGTNHLFKGAFTTARTLSLGDTFRINIGDLQISAD